MMKALEQWAANHGLLYQPPLPMQIEHVHPPEVEFEDEDAPSGAITDLASLRLWNEPPTPAKA